MQRDKETIMGNDGGATARKDKGATVVSDEGTTSRRGERATVETWCDSHSTVGYGSHCMKVEGAKE